MGSLSALQEKVKGWISGGVWGICVWGGRLKRFVGGGLGINLTVLAQASCGVVLFPWIVVEINGGLLVYLSWAIHY